MTNKPIVAIYSPAAGSGKSEVAKVLMRDFGFANVKFAAPLKDMVRGLLGSMGFRYDTIERMIEGDLKEAVVPGFATVTPRKLMQTLGTDWGREAVDNDLWVKVALNKVETTLHQTSAFPNVPGGVVIDDLRFPNEYVALKNAGATLVRLIRPRKEALGESRYEGLLDHHKFDVVIRNEGTLEQLHEAARGLLS